MTRPARLAVIPLEPRDVPNAVVDYTFSPDGRVPLPGLISVADLAFAPDGGIVATGRVVVNDQWDFGVVRLTADGKPDPGFGTNGLAVLGFEVSDYPSRVAVMPDGRVVVAGTVADVNNVTRVGVARLTAAGQPDPTFDGDGKAEFPLGVERTANRLRGLAVLPSGTVYVLGSFGDDTAARLTPGGQLDPAYGTGGKLTVPVPSGGTLWNADMDQAGRVLVGFTRPEPNPDPNAPPEDLGYTLYASRVTADGQPDPAFGTGGETLLQTGTLRYFVTVSYGEALYVQALPDGTSLFQRVIKKGQFLDPTDYFTYHLGADGQVQPGFDGNGLGVDPTQHLTELPDGRFLFDAVTRYTADGKPDPTFGPGGHQDVSDVLPEVDALEAVRSGPGMALAAGASGGQAFLARLVGSANTPPTANDDEFTVPGSGGPAGLPVLANDSTAPDAGEALAITGVTQPAAGGSVAFTPAGLTFTPAAGFTGDASFTYTVSDGDGGIDTATVTVHVVPPPGSPPPPATPPVSPPPPASPPPPGGPVPPTLRVAGLVAVGAGSGGQVRVLNPDGTERFGLAPFGAFTGGVRTAVGDFDGDGVDDVAVGTGPGTLGTVRVLSGRDQSELFRLAPFADFTGGLFVAAADLTGDGRADLVVTPDLTGGPRVRVFRGGDFAQVADFLGIDDPAFRGGARAAGGDVDGDGKADLIVAAGFGGGPRVAIFSGAKVAAEGGQPGLTSDTAEAWKLVGDFIAFDPGLRNGVYVAAGDVDGDGRADLIFGAGPSGGPEVRIVSGKSFLGLGGPSLTTPAADPARLADFFAGDVLNRGGLRVAAKDLDGDGRADLIVGPGEGGGSHVTAYSGRDLGASGGPPKFDLDAFPGSGNGVFVG